MICPKDDHRAYNRNDHAVEIEAGYSVGSKETEYRTSNDRADDTKRNIKKQALSLLINDFTSDKACN
jgi:hypothetical protein